MRRTRVAIAVAVVGLAGLMTITTAFAATEGAYKITRTGGLHFDSPGPTVTTSSGNNTKTLTGAGTVSGAGPTATATLSTLVVVTTGCINPGSKDQTPKGLEKSSSTLSGSTPFDTRAGTGSFTVSVTAGVGSRTCPAGQEGVVLVSVDFTNITLTVTSSTASGSTTAYFKNIDP